MSFDFDYVDDAPMKPVLSVREVEQRCNLEVPNPLIDAPSVSQSFKYLVERTSQLEDKNFTVPDDLFTMEAYEEMLAYTSEILEYDYLPLPVKEKQGEISLAMAAPVIGFLHKVANEKKREEPEVRQNILVVGAGLGKDIIRITTSFAYKRPRIVTVEPNKRHHKKLMRWFPDDSHYLGTFQRVWDSVQTHGPFDIIIANMSVHYVLGLVSPHSSPHPAHVFSSMLKPGGVMFGSYIDIPSVKASGEGLNMKCGHSVMYLSESNKVLNGMAPLNSVARIAVGGVVWEDPWVSTEQVYKMFEPEPVSVQIFDGTQMLYTTDVGPLFPCPIPGFYKKPKRPEVSVHRSLIITKHYDPAPREYAMGVPNCIKDYPEDGLAMRHRGVQLNKGLPFTHEDLEYLRPELMWAAEKLDGKSAYIIHSARALSVVVEGYPNPFKFNNYTSPFTKDFILQAEAMIHGDTMSLVVVDVLVAPWGSSGNFLSRWLWLEAIYEQPKASWPFMLQEWHRLGTVGFKTLCAKAREGIVLQGLTASPSAIVHGAGSARYIKREWTIERLVNGKIYECSLKGDIIKHRPDRTKPNPPHVVERIRHAMSYEDFVTYNQVVSGGHIFRNQIIDLINSVNPVSEWPKPALLWFYYNRCDPALQFYCGVNAVMSYRLATTDMFAKATVRVDEAVIPDVVETEGYHPGLDVMDATVDAATIELVASQTGASRAEAEAVLNKEGGDIINAIVRLTHQN